MAAFRAAIEEAVRGGALVAVPDEVVADLGGTGRIPVNATFDGVAYRGSVVRMGGRAIIGIKKAIRDEIGRGIGDPIEVTLERDDEERTVAMPDDLAAALAVAGLGDAFAGLSYSHRREYVEWIEGAKRPDTRARRVQGTIDRLS